MSIGRRIGRILGLLVGALMFATVATPALADCTHNGQVFVTGTIIGPLICGADGKWHGR